MAKKKNKTTEGRALTNDQSETTAPVRRRTASAGERAQSDDSPLGAGVSTTSEEVQVAHDTGYPDEGPTYHQIAEAAYQRYLERGGGDGLDFDDWLAAERELRERKAR